MKNVFPYRVAASDLDATLLGPDSTISEANRSAVRRIRKGGSKFVLASGRILQQMMPFYDELGLDTPLVASNGALVRFPNGDIISEVCLPPQVVRSLLRVGGRRKVTTFSHLRDGVYITSQFYWNADCQRHLFELGEAVRFMSMNRLMYGSPKVRKESGLARRVTNAPPRPTAAGLRSRTALGFKQGENGVARRDAVEPPHPHRSGKSDTADPPVYKVVWCAPADQIDVLYQYAVRRFAASVEVLRLNAEMIEFMPKGVDKAFGLKVVANYYGVDASQVAAFGDGANDVSMLSWVGMGVCMNHGSPLAKAAARLVAPASCPEDNFAKAVDTVGNLSRTG